jgi:hypothetical protein
VDDEDINKITHLNAMKHFQFDPFSVRPRETCTVGALREEASDVDTALVSRSKGGATANTGKIINMGTMTQLLDRD